MSNQKEMCFVGDSGYSYLDALIEGDKVTIRESRIEDSFVVQIGEISIQELARKLQEVTFEGLQRWQDVDEVETESKIIAGEGIYF